MARPAYYDTADLAAMFKRHPRTIRNWILEGCPTPEGPVRLRAARLGKRWTVKDEWLAAFELRVRPDPGGPELELE